MANPPPRYDKPRRFLKGIESLTYSLTEMRRQWLATTPRVITRDYRDYLDGGGAREKNIISPANEPFVTHSLQTHFVTLGDRKSTRLNSSHIQKSRMPSSA